jgi:hypothetical protein
MIVHNNRITHQIAGITFCTDANNPLSYLERGLFAQFVFDGSKPDVRQHFYGTTIANEPNDSINAGELNEYAAKRSQSLPWRSRLLTILDQIEQIDVAVGSDRAIIRNFSQCELDFFYLMEKIPGYDSKHNISYQGLSLAPTLRQIFSTFLPVFSAALIHSSGVVRNNLTALFLARSTGGKTTVAQSLHGGSVLSDDQVILRANDENVIIAHGTPFGRVTDGAISAKLGGLFLLEKAKQFELAPIKQLDMLDYLWNDQLSYTFFLPTDLRIKAYKMLYTTCQQVPCYRMRFFKEYVDWHAIDAVMANDV